MTKSKIFHTNAYRRIERDIVKLINSREDFMSARSITSPRAAGDAIQGILAEEFQSVIK